MIPCGSEAAYYRHIRSGESPCPEDRRAVNERSMMRRRARGVRPQLRAAHGTNSRYVDGCRCRPCRRAHADYQKEYRAGMRLSAQGRWSNPTRILDLLEVDGSWLTPDGISLRLDLSAETATRALYRLKGRGLVVSRQVELAYATGGHKHDGYTEWRLA